MASAAAAMASLQATFIGCLPRVAAARPLDARRILVVTAWLPRTIAASGNAVNLRWHPELISLINSENLHRARHLKSSKKVRQLHSPFVKLIADILARGVVNGVFRPGLDPVEVYITIAAVGYFYLSNNWTLSAIFG